MRVIERAEVARRLTYEACIPIVRQAMIDFSSGSTRQLLRSIIPLADGRLFGIMPGALGETAAFGAKLISVFPENFSRRIRSVSDLAVVTIGGGAMAGKGCSRIGGRGVASGDTCHGCG